MLCTAPPKKGEFDTRMEKERIRPCDIPMVNMTVNPRQHHSQRAHLTPPSILGGGGAYQSSLGAPPTYAGLRRHRNGLHGLRRLPAFRSGPVESLQKHSGD